MKPAISIITPVFNGRPYISACIDNVQGQGFAAAEHIIVDGGSTDGTLEIIRARAANDSRIRLITGPDRGQSDALNKGIAAATAPIVGILNCDDYYEPGVLSRAVDLFRGKPEPSLLVANCVVHNEVEGNSWVNRPRELRIERLMLGVEYVEFPGNPSAYFYHKSLHELTGPYDVEENYAMDLDFILAAVQSAHVYYFDEHWGNFRYHADAKTYVESKTREQKERLERIYRKYLRRLSLGQRAFVSLLKLRYVLKHQYWSLRRKLDNLLAGADGVHV